MGKNLKKNIYIYNTHTHTHTHTHTESIYIDNLLSQVHLKLTQHCKLFFNFFFFTLQYCIGFAIHQHESAMVI